MRSRSLCLSAVAGILLGGYLPAQTFKQDIPLTGLGNGAPTYSFGMAHDPASDRLFVAVSGSLGWNNEVVAILDPYAEAVEDSISVGLFPEDVAFVHDPAGGFVLGAVTNSSSGSVSLFDAAGSVVATVDLPDPAGFGAFPYGITASEDGTRFYVTTLDGSGAVYAVDVVTRGLDPAGGFSLGASSGGRLLAAAGRILLPTVAFGSAGSTPGVAAVDPVSGAVQWQHLLGGADPFFLASGQDLARLPDGSLMLGGLGLQGRLYHFTSAGTLLRTVRLTTPGGGAQGLAVSPDGTLLAACDLDGDAVALVDLVNMQEIAVADLMGMGQGYAQPNDACFHGGELYVTCQASPEVVVLENLPVVVPGPGFAGSLLLSDTAPLRGGSFTATASGAGTVALLMAFDDRPSQLQGVDLLIGPDTAILGGSPGMVSRSFHVPDRPKLRGKNVFFQGVTDAKGAKEPTVPRVAVIQ